MIVIRVTASDADLSGTAAELEIVGAAIRQLISAGESSLQIRADLTANPWPYELCLESLHVVRSSGPSQVHIQENKVLLVTGSDSNLDGFASWFKVLPGGHGHHEYFPGNEYIAVDSVPLVVSATA